jgi:acyl-[acyl-carrier-protein] desaturase
MRTHELPSVLDSPVLARGPWTHEARQRALDQEVLSHAVAYFGRAMQSRNWSPWHNLPLEEMGQLGHRLSQETIQLIEGFLGVEEYVGDYVQEGLTIFQHNRTRRNLQLQWGAEEARHGITWELVLLHSYVRTETQLQTYLDHVRDARWSMQQHPGIESQLGGTAYAMVQERATYFYYQELRARIRQEYGLSRLPTAEEQQRGYETGATEACRLVALDELAHHGLFLKIIQSYIKYFPSLTFDVLSKVFQAFEMPALRSLPNSRQFLRVVRRTGLHSSAIHREKVLTPVLKSLGLDGQKAFEKAVQTAQRLPAELGPDCIVLSRTGEWITEGSQPPVTR